MFRLERKNADGEWILCYESGIEDSVWEDYFRRIHREPGVSFRIQQVTIVTLATNEWEND